MRVAPAASMTDAPRAGGGVAPGVISVIRLTSTRTAPLNGAFPVPSRILAFVIRQPPVVSTEVAPPA
jgi:hypothetical protein